MASPRFPSPLRACLGRLALALALAAAPSLLAAHLKIHGPGQTLRSCGSFQFRATLEPDPEEAPAGAGLWPADYPVTWEVVDPEGLSGFIAVSGQYFAPRVEDRLQVEVLAQDPEGVFPPASLVFWVDAALPFSPLGPAAADPVQPMAAGYAWDAVEERKGAPGFALPATAEPPGQCSLSPEAPLSPKAPAGGDAPGFQQDALDYGLPAGDLFAAPGSSSAPATPVPQGLAGLDEAMDFDFGIPAGGDLGAGGFQAPPDPPPGAMTVAGKAKVSLHGAVFRIGTEAFLTVTHRGGDGGRRLSLQLQGEVLRLTRTATGFLVETRGPSGPEEALVPWSAGSPDRGEAQFGDQGKAFFGRVGGRPEAAEALLRLRDVIWAWRWEMGRRRDSGAIKDEGDLLRAQALETLFQADLGHQIGLGSLGALETLFQVFTDRRWEPLASPAACGMDVPLTLAAPSAGESKYPYGPPSLPSLSNLPPLAGRG